MSVLAVGWKKNCIVYKCIKPEGSDDSHTFWRTETGFRQEAFEGGNKKTVTAPHSLTAEMEPHFWKAASTVIISFLPQISNVWKMVNVKRKMWKDVTRLKKKKSQIKSHGGECNLKMPFLTAWDSGQQAIITLWVPVCGSLLIISLKAVNIPKQLLNLQYLI